MLWTGTTMRSTTSLSQSGTSKVKLPTTWTTTSMNTGDQSRRGLLRRRKSRNTQSEWSRLNSSSSQYTVFSCLRATGRSTRGSRITGRWCSIWRSRGKTCLNRVLLRVQGTFQHETEATPVRDPKAANGSLSRLMNSDRWDKKTSKFVKNSRRYPNNYLYSSTSKFDKTDFPTKLKKNELWSLTWL